MRRQLNTCMEDRHGSRCFPFYALLAMSSVPAGIRINLCGIVAGCHGASDPFLLVAHPLLWSSSDMVMQYTTCDKGSLQELQECSLVAQCLTSQAGIFEISGFLEPA